MIQNVLVVAPHTDDAEFGCGGTISKFIKEGKNVICVAFSSAEESVMEGLPKDINRTDMIRSMNILGVKPENLKMLNYRVRKFPEYRQEILDDLILLSNELHPDLVFLPSTFDTHQDHQVISQEGFRAFKKHSILGYEIPWNNLTFTTDSFVILNEDDVDKKIESVKCYISQLGRGYLNDNFLRSLMTTRGGQIGSEFAEAFQVVRWLIN
jgi:N-acetylglucosamine malate deacetylase 1